MFFIWSFNDASAIENQIFCMVIFFSHIVTIDMISGGVILTMLISFFGYKAYSHRPSLFMDSKIKLFGTAFIFMAIGFGLLNQQSVGPMSDFLSLPFVLMLFGLGNLMLEYLKGENSSPVDVGHHNLAHIVNIVQKMPIEEFVKELEHCSVGTLKRMIKTRGGTSLDCWEKEELVHKLNQCRRANDTCYICFEEYELRVPLRILRKCQHEFHVECIDQWAFTFSSKSRENHTPTCPLCKISLV